MKWPRSSVNLRVMKNLIENFFWGFATFCFIKCIFSDGFWNFFVRPKLKNWTLQKNNIFNFRLVWGSKYDFRNPRGSKYEFRNQILVHILGLETPYFEPAHYTIFVTRDQCTRYKPRETPRGVRYWSQVTKIVQRAGSKYVVSFNC